MGKKILKKKETKSSIKRTNKKDEVGRKYGFRSGLEDRISEDLTKLRVNFSYESVKIKYTKPAKKCTYTPDFMITLPSGKWFIVETKGRFVTEDRQKHIFIKEEHPEIDIKFLFCANNKIAKNSKTRYSDWCDKYGFDYAFKTIPKEWLEE